MCYNGPMDQIWEKIADRRKNDTGDVSPTTSLGTLKVELPDGGSVEVWSLPPAEGKPRRSVFTVSGTTVTAAAGADSSDPLTFDIQFANVAGVVARCILGETDGTEQFTMETVQPGKLSEPELQSRIQKITPAIISVNDALLRRAA